MTRSILVVIPGRPPSPNRQRVHWRVRHRSDQQWRTEARLTAELALPGDWPGPLARATLDVVHVVRDRRRRDIDNLAGATKSSLDGMVDAGLLADDSATVLVSITHRVEHVPGLTETRYTFTEAPE